MSLGNFASALVSQGVNAAAGASRGSRARLEQQQKADEEDKRLRANMMLVSLQTRPDWMRQGFGSQEAADAHAVEQAGKVSDVRAAGVARHRAPPRSGTGSPALTHAEKLVDDARANLTAATGGMPKRPASAALLPEVASQFSADSASAAPRVEAARKALEDAEAERDRLLRDIGVEPTPTGGRAAPEHAPPGGAARTPVPAPTRQGGAPAAGGRLYNGKTAAAWVGEVKAEHPDWSKEQIATEARTRAGAAAR